jgi:formylglycine-generating enzyme required for sulfatase activity
MFDLVDLPMDWPVVVNYHEAKAYCAWKGPDYRLPTEAEHHAMRGYMVSQGPHSLTESFMKT